LWASSFKNRVAKKFAFEIARYGKFTMRWPAGRPSLGKITLKQPNKV
jgi:hypothetical protein